MVEVVSAAAVSGALFAVGREEGVSFLVLLVAVGAFPFGRELVPITDGGGAHIRGGRCRLAFGVGVVG